MFRGSFELRCFFPVNSRSLLLICSGSSTANKSAILKRPIDSHTDLDHSRLGLQPRRHKRYRCRWMASEPALTRSAQQVSKERI
jgi:hypothetical protein